GDDRLYLKENTDVFVSTHDGEVLGVDVPLTVDLRVTRTEPGFAGDTATGAKKPATLETGLVVQVPLFVTEGDTIRVDTRTGEDRLYLKENTDVFVSTHDGEVLGVDVPLTVDLRVTRTEPGFAGDTATGAKKPATLETGLVVQVPLFVTEGDTIRVDTRNGEYVTRV